MSKLVSFVLFVVLSSFCQAQYHHGSSRYSRHHRGSSYYPSRRSSYPVIISPRRYHSSSSSSERYHKRSHHHHSTPVCTLELEWELKDVDLGDTVKCKAGNSGFWKCKVRGGGHSGYGGHGRYGGYHGGYGTRTNQIGIPVGACMDSDTNIPPLINGNEVSTLPTSTIYLTCQHRHLQTSGGGITAITGVTKVECGGQCALQMQADANGRFTTAFGSACPIGGTATVNSVCIIPNNFNQAITVDNFCIAPRTMIRFYSEGETLSFQQLGFTAGNTITLRCNNGILSVSSGSLTLSTAQSLNNLGAIGCA